MRNSKRVVGKSKSYRSSVNVKSSRVRSASRFQSSTDDSRSLSQKIIGSWGAKFFAVFALVLLIGAMYEFFSEDGFFINQFEVLGLNYLTPNDVERASRVNGYNVFFVEPSAVERALKKMPEIKSAHVALGLPNTILVQIIERDPEAVWLKSDQAFWVDSDGFVFKARAAQVDLPTVRDLDAGELKAGHRIQPAPLSAIRALRLAWTDGPKNFEWSSVSGLSTIDEHGWKILFGDVSDMEWKVAKLLALVPALVSQGTRVKLIDLGKGDPYYQ